MKIKEITDAIERFAPLHLQESYDNSGVQVGDVNEEVSGVLLCIDITEEVIDEALQKGCNLIISHHPLIFRGIKKIAPTNYISRCIIKAIEHRITLYSSHTNMDKAPQGVSYQTATRLGINVEKMLSPEEGNEQYGLGVVGELSEAMDADMYLARVKEIVGIGSIRHTDTAGRKVKRIALCGGAGHEFLPLAKKAKADLYLTADLKYHEFFETEGEIILADFGHFESEQFTKEIFFEIVSKINPTFADIYLSDSKTNPINYI